MYYCANDCGAEPFGSETIWLHCPKCGGELVWLAPWEDLNVIDGTDQPYAWDLPEDDD